MTVADIVQVSADEARQMTDQIKVAVETSWHLIVRAYQTGAHIALGYKSWDDYTTREFGTARLRLPREDRNEVVGSLRDAGLSIRAIASVTGDSTDTVRKAINAGVRNLTPAKSLERTTVTPNFKAGTVKGTDGKTYPSKVDKPKATPSRRGSLVDSAQGLGVDLRRITDRLGRLRDDDRLTANKQQVASHLRSHLLNTVEVCQDLLNRIEP